MGEIRLNVIFTSINWYYCAPLQNRELKKTYKFGVSPQELHVKKNPQTFIIII